MRYLARLALAAVAGAIFGTILEARGRYPDAPLDVALLALVLEPLARVLAEIEEGTDG